MHDRILESKKITLLETHPFNSDQIAIHWGVVEVGQVKFGQDWFDWSVNLRILFPRGSHSCSCSTTIYIERIRIYKVSFKARNMKNVPYWPIWPQGVKMKTLPLCLCPKGSRVFSASTTATLFQLQRPRKRSRILLLFSFSLLLEFWIPLSMDMF